MRYAVVISSISKGIYCLNDIKRKLQWKESSITLTYNEDIVVVRNHIRSIVAVSNTAVFSYITNTSIVDGQYTGVQAVTNNRVFTRWHD